MGYHRDTFYEIKRAFQVGGVHALVEQKRGPRDLPPDAGALVVTIPPGWLRSPVFV
jgi:hypothetical protein